MYICQIVSLASFSNMFSLFWGDSCRAPFHCSHMSQATFHSFLMISAIHHQLGLRDLSCFQICFCFSLHSMLSYPSHMYCFLICDCSCCSGSCSCLLPAFFGSFHILHNVFISCSHMLGSVPSCFSQSLIFINDLHQSSCACCSGHLRMCFLSSAVLSHRGHCAGVRNFHLCMFFPVVKCPDMYFATHLHWLTGSSCIAWPIDSQSILFQIPWESVRRFSQYDLAACPLMWSHIWWPKSFSTWALPI